MILIKIAFILLVICSLIAFIRLNIIERRIDDLERDIRILQYAAYSSVVKEDDMK